VLSEAEQEKAGAPLSFDRPGPETSAATEPGTGTGQDRVGPVLHERRSLLGTFPIPSPHLVGTQVPSAPGHPSRWRPRLPPLQYGIDYTFLRSNDGQPVTWGADRPIIVRLCGPHESEHVDSLAKVVAELAELTGLRLATGAVRARPLDPRTVPKQEIHVGFLRTLPAVPSLRPCAGRVGLGGATVGRGGFHYASGFAVVVGSAMEPPSMWELTVLRHELAHAVGLGHAARPDLLMYHRISKVTADFGRGDRRGLQLLNGKSPPGA
jgi:Matrixin